MKKSVLLLMGFLLAGCSEESPTDSVDSPSLPIVAFRGPVTASTHAEADSVRLLVSGFNAFTTSLDAFSLAQPSISGSIYTWTITEAQLTLRLIGELRADSGYNWKLILNGNDGGVTYNNWTAFDGSTDALRRNATWYIYHDNTTTKNADFLWTISSNGSLVGTRNAYSNGSVTDQTVITDNANLTGEARVYRSGVLRYRAIWLSNGNGQYWYYDVNGAVTSQGSWQ